MIEATSGPLGWTLGGIYATLAAATGITGALRRMRPSWDVGQVWLRIRSWWFMTIIFTVVVLVHPTLSVVFFGLVSVLAFREFARLLPQPRLSPSVMAVAYAGIIGQYVFVAEGDYGLFVLFIGLYIFLAVPALGAVIGQTDGFATATGGVLFGLFATTFTIGHAPMLLQLPSSAAAPAGAAGLLVYLVVLTEANDVAQFLWGKALGKHRAARVSPGKTVEGLIGGIGTSGVLGIALAPLLTPFSAAVGLFVGCAIGAAGFLGDITVSALKRDAGVKDSGSLLPGHGGVLDRIDSLIVTAPLFFHFFRYFYGSGVG